MPADLIIYVLVAAGLIFWLRNVLGTRHGEERERPDPFTAHPEDVQAAQEDSKSVRESTTPMNEHERIQDLAKNPTSTLSVLNDTAENGLLDIAKADKDFDITFFLEAAQDVFVMGVEAFGEGDRDTLQDLLDTPVYDAFSAAITAREAAHETMENEIHAIHKAEVTAAMLDGKTASITVRFTADEITVTRDKDDKVIAGSPERISEMRDIWTFARDVKSRDPRWLVTETRGDFDGDNESIPNSV